MGLPELFAGIIGSTAFIEIIRWLAGRDKTKRELRKSDMDADERYDQIINDRFTQLQKQLRKTEDRVDNCQRRCDRYSDLTLDLLDALATHGVSEIDEFRRRYRDIRELGRPA